KLQARREQYQATLQQLAGDVLAEADMKGAITIGRTTEAMHRLETTANDLRMKRTQILESIRTNTLPPSGRGRSEELGQKRAELIFGIEELRKRAADVAERID